MVWNSSIPLCRIAWIRKQSGVYPGCSFPFKQTSCWGAGVQFRAAEVIEPSTTSSCRLVAPSVSCWVRKTWSGCPSNKEVAAAMVEQATSEFTDQIERKVSVCFPTLAGTSENKGKSWPVWNCWTFIRNACSNLQYLVSNRIPRSHDLGSSQAF